MKASKTMRTSKPARSSAKAAGKAVKADALKARVLELCELAEASVAAVRNLDLEAEDSAEKFDEAYRGVMDAGCYFQGIEEALEARQKMAEAAKALRHVWGNDDPLDWGPGPTKVMMAEARQKLAAAAA